MTKRSNVSSNAVFARITDFRIFLREGFLRKTSSKSNAVRTGFQSAKIAQKIRIISGHFSSKTSCFTKHNQANEN